MDDDQQDDARAPRSSSAVLRAATIIDFMAEHPHQAFSMAELVRALKLSQSTCHSLLNALVMVGYLFRTTDRTYVLGPGLAAISRIAAGRFSALQIAHPEMRKLADRFNVACSATFQEGPWSVVRDRASSARTLGATADLGMPVRLRAPLAALYFAWRPDEAEQWLSTVTADRDREREVLECGTQFVRDHGFIVFLKRARRIDNRLPPEQLFEGSLDDLPFTLATSIKQDGHYDVSSIAAPIVNGGGHVEFMISMRGFDTPLVASDILTMAEALKLACGRISAFCGAGRDAAAYSHG